MVEENGPQSKIAGIVFGFSDACRRGQPRIGSTGSRATKTRETPRDSASSGRTDAYALNGSCEALAEAVSLSELARVWTAPTGQEIFLAFARNCIEPLPSALARWV